MIPESKWEWYGYSGHFICGSWCRFHMLTKVGKWLISTVGSFVHPLRYGKNEEDEAAWLKVNYPGEDIGCGRKFETMVFLAGKKCNSPTCGCGQPQILNGNELEMLGANDAGMARRNHMKLCRKYAKKD